MKVSIHPVHPDQAEEVIIHCYEVTEEVQSIVRFVKSTDVRLPGYLDEKATWIALQDLFFVESVDNKVFGYTSDKTYELKCKLYSFLEQYENRYFFRCSKSCVINLMKIDHVRPCLNGRLTAKLFNGEEIIISRQYVPELKKRLAGVN